VHKPRHGRVALGVPLPLLLHRGQGVVSERLRAQRLHGGRPRKRAFPVLQRQSIPHFRARRQLQEPSEVAQHRLPSYERQVSSYVTAPHLPLNHDAIIDDGGARSSVHVKRLGCGRKPPRRWCRAAATDSTSRRLGKWAARWGGGPDPLHLETRMSTQEVDIPRMPPPRVVPGPAQPLCKAAALPCLSIAYLSLLNPAHLFTLVRVRVTHSSPSDS